MARVRQSAGGLRERRERLRRPRAAAAAAGGARLLESDLRRHLIRNLAGVAPVPVGGAVAALAGAGRGDAALRGRLDLRARGGVRRKAGVVPVDVARDAVLLLLVRAAPGVRARARARARAPVQARGGAERPRFLRAPVLGEREALHGLAPVLRHRLEGAASRRGDGTSGGGESPRRASRADARATEVRASANACVSVRGSVEAAATSDGGRVAVCDAPGWCGGARRRDRGIEKATCSPGKHVTRVIVVVSSSHRPSTVSFKRRISARARDGTDGPHY